MGGDHEPADLRTMNRAAAAVACVALVLIAIAAFAWTPAVAPALGYLVVALCVWTHDRWLIAFAFLVSLAIFLVIVLASAGAVAFAAGGGGMRTVAAAGVLALCVAAGCIGLAVLDAWSAVRPRRQDPRRGFEVILTPRPGPRGADAPPEEPHG